MKKTLTLLTALLLFSCGSRKSEVSKQETKVDTELTIKEAKTKTTENKEVAKVEEKKESDQKENAKVEEQKNVEKNETTTTTNIKPIDKTKPSSVKDSKGKVWELTNAELTEIVTNATLKDNSKIVSEYENELKASQTREFNYLKDNKTLETKNKSLESKIKTLEQSKNKVTEKTNGWNLFFLGLALGIFIVVGWINRKKLFV